MTVEEFRVIVQTKGEELYRDMAWRRDTRPYYVLVSEIMLQQTQVSRVETKFQEFIERFPNVEVLAKAPLGDVLQTWNGLGYNRRAKYLWQAAQAIVHEHGGTFPATKDSLMSLPGVGENTAGAIMAYAFNVPIVFIETNIRTVYLHHFFKNRDKVADSEIRELVAKTLDKTHPREWYWALMDYGVWLKAQKLGHISNSKHYTKQSKLAGSLREMRGRILKTLADGQFTTKNLRQATHADERFEPAKRSLQHEGLIEKTSQYWRLPQ